MCTDYKPRVLLMRVNETLVAQTFAAVPTSVTVADYALFFAVAPIIVFSYSQNNEIDFRFSLQRICPHRPLVLLHAGGLRHCLSGARNCED